MSAAFIDDGAVAISDPDDEVFLHGSPYAGVYLSPGGTYKPPTREPRKPDKAESLSGDSDSYYNDESAESDGIVEDANTTLPIASPGKSRDILSRPRGSTRRRSSIYKRSSVDGSMRRSGRHDNESRSRRVSVLARPPVGVPRTGSPPSLGPGDETLIFAPQAARGGGGSARSRPMSGGLPPTGSTLSMLSSAGPPPVEMLTRPPSPAHHPASTTPPPPPPMRLPQAPTRPPTHPPKPCTPPMVVHIPRLQRAIGGGTLRSGGSTPAKSGGAPKHAATPVLIAPLHTMEKVRRSDKPPPTPVTTPSAGPSRKAAALPTRASAAAVQASALTMEKVTLRRHHPTPAKSSSAPAVHKGAVMNSGDSSLAGSAPPPPPAANAHARASPTQPPAARAVVSATQASSRPPSLWPSKRSPRNGALLPGKHATNGGSNSISSVPDARSEDSGRLDGTAKSVPRAVPPTATVKKKPIQVPSAPPGRRSNAALTPPVMKTNAPPSARPTPYSANGSTPPTLISVVPPLIIAAGSGWLSRTQTPLALAAHARTAKLTPHSPSCDSGDGYSAPNHSPQDANSAASPAGGPSKHAFSPGSLYSLSPTQASPLDSPRKRQARRVGDDELSKWLLASAPKGAVSPSGGPDMAPAVLYSQAPASPLSLPLLRSPAYSLSRTTGSVPSLSQPSPISSRPVGPRHFTAPQLTTPSDDGVSSDQYAVPGAFVGSPTLLPVYPGRVKAAHNPRRRASAPVTLTSSMRDGKGAHGPGSSRIDRDSVGAGNGHKGINGFVGNGHARSPLMQSPCPYSDLARIAGGADFLSAGDSPGVSARRAQVSVPATPFADFRLEAQRTPGRGRKKQSPAVSPLENSLKPSCLTFVKYIRHSTTSTIQAGDYGDLFSAPCPSVENGSLTGSGP